MLTELRLQNFRCFQDHAVPFKATSIAIGRNNAGKSTLVEALRLVEIMPQVAPVARDEVVLSGDYVKSALSSSLAPLHFRNQLKALNEHFSVFKELTEDTWPGLQIRELVCARSFPGEPLELMVRDEGFVAEIASMGHGLQMWLQTMWFI